MSTSETSICGIGIVYEINATDKNRRYDTTQINGFSISFELIASDKYYLETSIINGFSIEFEYNTLYVEEVYEQLR